MERLTERTGEGQAIPRMDLKNNGHQRCMERLAEYEDFEEIFRSKMTDASCDSLKDKEEFAKWLDRNKWIAKKCDEYARAEEQGRLLKLRCAVGDMVYVKMQFGGYAEAEVRGFTYFLTCGFCIVVTSKLFDKQNIPLSEFGKTVFLTKEEARLEDMKNGINE